MGESYFICLGNDSGSDTYIIIETTAWSLWSSGNTGSPPAFHSASMVSPASIIPVDLFENILFFVGDVSKLNPGLDRPARRIEMKHLSACSATCVYWANLTRQRMFTHLILQSYEDFCGLQTLLRAPSSSRIYSISALLRSLEVFYKLGDQSWFHSVAALRASAAPRLRGIGLHIVGPPTPALIAATGRGSVLHPLYFSTPRLLPPTIFHDLYPDVFVEDIHLPNAAALFNLLQDCVSLLPWRLYCRNLTWDHSSRATPSSAGLKAACRREYAMRQMNSWGCTDDILVAFMTQSVPHHELSLRRLGPHLSFADTKHLFEAMIATGRQFTDEDDTPNPFWIESLCHVDSIQKYTAIPLQPSTSQSISVITLLYHLMYATKLLCIY